MAMQLLDQITFHSKVALNWIVKQNCGKAIIGQYVLVKGEIAYEKNGKKQRKKTRALW